MSNNETAGGSPFNRWWWVALGAVILVAVLAVLIATGVLGNGSTAQPAPSASATEVTPPTGAPSPDDPDVPTTGECGVADGSQDIPVTGPPAVWEANVYFLYPTSEEYGPLPNPDSSLWGCFQHSPTGALFAAANAFSGLLSGDRQAFVMEGALENGREAWLEAFADSPEGQSAGRVAQISAFQFQSVEDDRVVVALGLVQDEVTGVISVALEYVDGNWLVDLPSSAFRPVGSDLAGYTPWSAE